MGFIPYNINMVYIPYILAKDVIKLSFDVVFYDQNGKYPVGEFISSLDKKMKSRIYKNIELLEENGNMLGMPFSKHLEDGIFELRTSSGNNITRVLYFFVIGQKIVMTNGFIKKTEKTPAKEIELAKKRRNEYLNR